MSNPKSQQPINLYQLFGVSNDATIEEIKKKYRKLALSRHPDHGGNIEEFQQLNNAYLILSDPNKRKHYDKHGINEDALFRMDQNEPQLPKNTPICTNLVVTLEDIYLGTRKEIHFACNRICNDCDGTGLINAVSIDNIPHQLCLHCKQTGYIIKFTQMGPLTFQNRMPCHHCNTTGKIISQEYFCQHCFGKKYCFENITLSINLKKGMHDLEKIIIHDAGNMEENTLPGDVIVTIQTAEHAIFKRNHKHLLTTIHLNYYEACIGFNKVIHYLDGTKLNINYSTGGQTIQPSSIYKIINYGLPINENPFVRGNLYIQFIIQLPNNIHNSNHIVEYFETQPFIDHSHNNKNKEEEERQLLFPQVITDLTLSTMDEYIKEDISSHTQQQDDHNNKYEPGNSNHPPNCQTM